MQFAASGLGYMHYISWRRNPRPGTMFALVMVAEEPIDELRSRANGSLRRLAARIVSDAGQDRSLDRRIAFLLGDLDLAQRAVLVVLALHDQHRHADVAERISDIPVAELWIEPRLAPGAERTIDIGVPTLEFFAQRAGGECGARPFDLGDTHVLGEEMR